MSDAATLEAALAHNAQLQTSLEKAASVGKALLNARTLLQVRAPARRLLVRPLSDRRKTFVFSFSFFSSSLLVTGGEPGTA